MSKIAPKNTRQAEQFLRENAASGTKQWYRMCLKLQRMARGLPPVYPTAAAAQEATPQSERVVLNRLKPGMVIFTKGSDPAGHIAFVDRWNPGQKNSSNLMVWSNDMSADGRKVALVPLSRIETRWNHKFQFGATWLNGYDFSEFNQKPKAIRGSLGNNYKHAIEDMERVIANKKKRGNKELVKLLERDLDVMKKRYNKFSK